MSQPSTFFLMGENKNDSMNLFYKEWLLCEGDIR